jgi:uncharacterized protein YraI
VALVTSLALAGPASAARFGSSLKQPADAGFGCESVPTFDVFTGAPTLAPSGHTTCTVRSSGRIGSNKNWSSVPSDGRIVRISVRSGPNPAPLRLSVAEASTRANPNGAGGDFLCCTVRHLGRTFRPRANAVTSQRVNVRVSRDKVGNASYYDVVGLAAMGPGTLPLHDERTAGQFAQGSGLVNFDWPHVRRGESRVGSHGADGLELLFRWEFERAR